MRHYHAIVRPLADTGEAIKGQDKVYTSRTSAQAALFHEQPISLGEAADLYSEGFVLVVENRAIQIVTCEAAGCAAPEKGW